jgi:hypothetical protein
MQSQSRRIVKFVGHSRLCLYIGLSRWSKIPRVQPLGLDKYRICREQSIYLGFICDKGVIGIVASW